MSEATIQSGIQAAIQAMSEFADADVVINDYRFKDQPTANAPYVLIENSDDFTSDQDASTPQNTWFVPVTLFERFSDWKETYDNFRTRRQAILDKINSGSVRTAGGLSGTNVRRVRNDGSISYVYQKYLPPEQEQFATPMFIAQRMILETEEF